MRVLLEPELAAMAAASITDETLARLGKEIERMSALEADPEAYLEVDHEFHMEICRAADNRILDRIMYSARWLGTASRRITNEAPAGLRRATAQHTEIYEALVARDPAARPRGDAQALEQQLLHAPRGEGAAKQAGRPAALAPCTTEFRNR